MTIKIITGYSPEVLIASPITEVSVTATGYVHGAVDYGIEGGALGAYTVINDGRVVGADVAVVLEKGGVITNHAGGLMSGGFRGVYILGAVGTITNYGSILTAAGASVYGAGLKLGGRIANGTTTNPTALIKGATGVALYASGSVTNSGSIIGTSNGGSGAFFGAAGTLTNGGYADATALIRGGRGVWIAGVGSVANFGSIIAAGTTASPGVNLLAGGRIVSGSALDTQALISGLDGVDVAGAAGTVINFGTISGLGSTSGGYGVSLAAGGAVTNGSAGDHAALIKSVRTSIYLGGGAGTVLNFGSITSAVGYGVQLANGGKLVNGSGTDPQALVQGYLQGVYGQNAGATIANFGSIEATAYSAGSAGVSLYGGAVTNGSASDRTALIEGYYGVAFLNGGGVGVVHNFGTVLAQGPAASRAVSFAQGGTAINGTVSDTRALISGGSGVDVFAGAGDILNYGTIQSTTGVAYAPGYGVQLNAGGGVSNGAPNDLAALIEGYRAGISDVGASANVVNFGTIRATGGYACYGMVMTAGGFLTNGSTTDQTAAIAGFGGVLLDGVTAVNYGTIQGTGVFGAVLGAGSSLTNGGSTVASSVIKGFTGAYAVAGNVTLTNFGVIAGSGGQAVNFLPNTDTLVVEAGSSFVGSVNGGGGALELGGGTGTLTGLLAGGAVTVSGSMATTKFTAFETVKIDAPASFTLVGGGSIAAGQFLAVGGAATTTGTLFSAGALSVSGTLAGTGTLALTGGTATFNTGAILNIAKATETGATAVANSAATSVTFAGLFTQTAGTVSASAGDRFTFTGAGDSFAGTLAGLGTVALAGGSDTLAGTTLKAKNVSLTSQSVTLSGTISNASAVAVATSGVVIAASGATLTGAGSVALSNLATNKITGATAAATLTNVSNKISGAGNLGGGLMTLVNLAGGTINSNQTLGLTIDTGAATITNGGTIENTGAGIATIKSALNNTGILMVTAGVLAVNTAVTGTGVVKIGGGRADFVSIFAQNVSFTGAIGVLELGHGQTYSGSISGFSKTGSTSLDLDDIAFGGSTTATYSGTTSGGVLTVSDGTHTAHISLIGDYTASSFVAASDGHGGTILHDPTRAPAIAPRVLPLIAAAASFGAASGGGAAVMDAWSERIPNLVVAPRFQAA